jgi:hypothetical protein
VEEFMQKLELTLEEAEVLKELLQHGLTEVDVEVFRTDTHDFKEMLKHRRDVLGHVMTKLTAMPVGAS